MRSWAFSIWGLIFSLEGIGTIYQALPYGYNSEGTKQRIVNAIGGLHPLHAHSSSRVCRIFQILGMHFAGKLEAHSCHLAHLP